LRVCCHVVRRPVGPPGGQERHPARDEHEPEGDQAVQQHRCDRLRDAQAHGDEPGGHGRLDHPEPAWSQPETGDSGAGDVGQRQTRPGHGRADRGDRRREAEHVGHPVEQCEAANGGGVAPAEAVLGDPPQETPDRIGGAGGRGAAGDAAGAGHHTGGRALEV